MYAQDSFFDLSLWGRAGLLCLSATLFILFLFLARLLYRIPRLWPRILGSLLLFWIFVWVSPQIYYQYYHLLFEFLPDQWVIGWPPGPIKPLQFLTFQGPQNLSAHSQGVLGWCLLVVPLIQRGPRGMA